MRDSDTCTLGRTVPTAPKRLFMRQLFPNDAPKVNGAGRKIEDINTIITGDFRGRLLAIFYSRDIPKNLLITFADRFSDIWTICIIPCSFIAD